MEARQVQRLYGKVFMGPFLIPHYYVKFAESSEPEFVPCTKVSLTAAQRAEFDSFFRDEERRMPTSDIGSGDNSQKAQAKPDNSDNLKPMEDFPGEKGKFTWTFKDSSQKGTNKSGGYKARKALNFLDMESSEVRVTHGDRSVTPLLKKVKKEKHSPLLFESDYEEDLDSYDASFIDDGTPRVYSRSTPGSSKKSFSGGSSKKVSASATPAHSSKGSTTASIKSGAGKKNKRKRIVLEDSDDDSLSFGSSIDSKKWKKNLASKPGDRSSSDENGPRKPVVDVITLSP